MSTGRSNRPLFDMLDGARSKPRVTVSHGPLSSGSPHVELKPKISVQPRGSSSVDLSRKIGLFARIRLAIRPFLGESTMVLPANAVYYAAAGVVLAVVFAWVIGYRSGAANKGKELAPFTQPEPLKVREPLPAPPPKPSPVVSQAPTPAPATPSSVEANRPAQLPTEEPTAPAGSSPAQTPVEVSATARPTSAEDVLLAQGWSSKDPREVGLNYLYLPVVARPEAEQAVKFFADNSLEVMAVPLKVDRRGTKGNNPPPSDAVYRLVLRRGITGEEYSREGSVKQAMQTTVLRLGQIWKRDHKGTTDFSRYSWEKLVEPR